MQTSVREDDPALVVGERELVALDASLSTMCPIPGSRMFEIRDALAVYRKNVPGGEVFDASQGDGGASLPGVAPEILDAAHALLREHGNAYDQPYGTDAFRRATFEQYWHLDAATGRGPECIVACQGGRDALLKAYDAALWLGHGRRGDFVVTSRVPWISYNWGPYAIGANVLLAPGREQDAWELTPEGVRECVAFAGRHGGRKVALLVVTSPDNPTGRTLDLARQLELARAAFAAGVPFVLLDWMYHWISDEPPHDLNRFFLELSPAERDRIIVVDGITKSLGASNVRGAHLVAAREAARFVASRASHGVIPSFHSQAVALAAYRAGFARAVAPIAGPTGESRRRVRRFVAEKGLRHVLGQGYYAFLDVGPAIDRAGLADSAEFGSRLAERHGLAVVPGIYFSPAAARWIRFSYAGDHRARARAPVDGAAAGILSVQRADWQRFGEKVRIAVASSLGTHAEGGTSGVEVELNILDDSLRPVQRLEDGGTRRSFADEFLERHVPPWARPRVQREVFHWMVEIATRPYYSPRGSAYEARLLEGVLLNALAEAELGLGRRLYALHGNLPVAVEPDAGCVPDGWSLAKRRYLARCVSLFGRRLATAGVHTNHSLPEALLSWDFFHLPLSEREGRSLAEYRSDAMIRAARLLRPYCALFIAVSAASPFATGALNGEPVIELTDCDSVRLLTFPNPEALDVPGLYASHQDYLRLSYELVRGGVRFGGNNWTPVRARSDVDPVNRIISATSEQLQELYGRGLYPTSAYTTLEDAERHLMIENLCALVDLPMTRVEVRTDEGGDDLPLSVAKVAFKELLLLRVYADPEHGVAYRYDARDVARARRNEEAAARRGLDAQLEHPLGDGAVPVREWLAAVLDELAPLAEVLEYTELLAPLREMAEGGPNPAARARRWFAERMGRAERSDAGAHVVPRQLMLEWLELRAREVARDAESAAADAAVLGLEAGKLGELAAALGEAGRANPALPVQAGGPARCAIAPVAGRTGEVLDLAAELIRIASVTNCARERPDEVLRCARFLGASLSDAGLEVRLWDHGRYPGLLAGFPGALLAPVTLAGHFDVVEPDPDERQFEPRLDGEYLWGRGAADMKTVVASFVVWMRGALAKGAPYPPINLLLVGNEENGEAEPFGTPHLLRELRARHGWEPELMIVGERTGERGDELLGEICIANRGVVRCRFVARSERGHTGFASAPRSLVNQLIEVRERVAAILPRYLTLARADGWNSAAAFPFLNVGEPGVYNLSAAEGVLGLEVRPIPEDDHGALLAALAEVAAECGVELLVDVIEGGMACPDEDPHVARLAAAVERVGGGPPRVGRKLAGTSARFAPGGRAVVWGQSGVGPHTREERHYVPSIAPYLAALDEFSGSGGA
ncbi:MAG: M20/M25/M40 family metallo-hydrolase [Acidobacteria bacterium]|nr:M20/M25/M40 family metallo-hydrolase [Acidobacteriota bacterium]